MSEHIAAGSARLIKQTCRKCNRNVYVFMIDGKRVETDPELISVVTNDNPKGVLARRVHGELCLRYQSEAARTKALQEAKRQLRNEADTARLKGLQEKQRGKT